MALTWAPTWHLKATPAGRCAYFSGPFPSFQNHLDFSLVRRVLGKGCSLFASFFGPVFFQGLEAICCVSLEHMKEACICHTQLLPISDPGYATFRKASASGRESERSRWWGWGGGISPREVGTYPTHRSHGAPLSLLLPLQMSPREPSQSREGPRLQLCPPVFRSPRGGGGLFS